jgi:hypothetical protein
MAFKEDFSAFFNADGFGDDFIYTPKVGAAISAVGIFDDAYYAEQGGEVAVAGSQPRIQYESAKIPDPVYGESITVKGKDYKIIEIQPDGTGTTTILLELQDGAC